MVAVQIGDGRDVEEAFSSEIASHISTLRGIAKRLTRNEEAAADLTQETLTKAWAARSRFAVGTNMKAWLITIMHNQFRSEMRRAWRQAPWQEEAFEQIPAPRDEQSWSIDLGDAARAISSLSRYQREALILSAVGGFTGDDVGAIVQCGRAAAKSRVCRARHAVISMLDGTEPLKAKRNKTSRDSIDELLSELQLLTVATPALSEAGAVCHG